MGRFFDSYPRSPVGTSRSIWEGRYHATMVDSGEYLWECLNYVELNMVRCGVVVHPRQWDWSGYAELMGRRRRNRLLDEEKLLWLLRTKDVEEFRKHLDASLEERIAKDQLKRDSRWTESIGVGSEAFVERLEASVRNRQEVEVQSEGGTWVLRESHGPILGGQNRPIGALGPLEFR